MQEFARDHCCASSHEYCTSRHTTALFTRPSGVVKKSPLAIEPPSSLARKTAVRSNFMPESVTKARARRHVYQSLIRFLYPWRCRTAQSGHASRAYHKPSRELPREGSRCRMSNSCMKMKTVDGPVLLSFSPHMIHSRRLYNASVA